VNIAYIRRIFNLFSAYYTENKHPNHRKASRTLAEKAFSPREPTGLTSIKNRAAVMLLAEDQKKLKIGLTQINIKQACHSPAEAGVHL
jgi:ABC-type branched-subunit amino acid transport system ATPase component